MRSVIILLFLSTGSSILLSSCSTEFATVKSKQQFYSYLPNTGSSDLTLYENKTSFKAKVKEDADVLFFSLDDKSMKMKDIEGTKEDKADAETPIITIVSGVKPARISGQVSDSKAIIEPPSFYFSSKEITKDIPTNLKPTFTYKQWKPFVQAITIPIKFRFAVSSMPTQTEGGVSGALSAGYKHSWNTYSGNKNALGATTTSLSLAWGGFAGFGTVDLKASSTRSQLADANATKNLIIPFGIQGVAGYNNINIGLAVGIDAITGPNRKLWIYRNEPWIGITVGLDIIK